LQLSTIWGCCSVLNRAVAPLPIYIVEKNGASRKILDNHYLADVLGFAPNPLMTSLELLEAMLLSFNLWGNAYVEKRLIAARCGRCIRWTHRACGSSSRMAMSATNTRRRLASFRSSRKKRSCTSRISHSTASTDFRRSPACARWSAAASTRSDSARTICATVASPVGVLEHPKTLGDEARKKMRKDWQELHSGPNNSGNIAILWEGMQYKTISFNPEDLQYIELTKLTKAEIAEAYGVPLNLLAQADKTSTYASAEQFDLQFVKYTISPLCRRFEIALKKSCWRMSLASPPSSI
jgi:phage portal protein BeeE